MITSPARDKFNSRFLPYATQSLVAWRSRHPLRRVVEPLPMDEQTRAANRALTPVELWDCYAYDALLSKVT